MSPEAAPGALAAGGDAADFSYPQLRPSTSDLEQAAAARDLTYRLIPDRAAEFSFTVNASLLDERGRDLFTVSSRTCSR